LRDQGEVLPPPASWKKLKLATDGLALVLVRAIVVSHASLLFE
jgi:hypothetical protein